MNKFQNSIISSYSSTSKNKNQVWQKNYSLPVSPTPIQEFVCLTEIEKRVFAEIIKFDNNFTALYFSQGWLAKKLGYCRKTINETLWSLRQRGYITSHYNHFSTCDYKLSDYFKLIPVRQVLTPYIKAFAFISLSVLSTTILHAENNNNPSVTRVKSPFVFIKPLPTRISNGGGLYTSKVVKKVQNHFSHRKRKSFIMHNPIIPEIRHIPGVKLTIAQQIALSLFPAAAVRFAVKEMMQCKDIRSPFGWLRTVCRKYCEEHGINPNYVWVSALEAAYKSNPKQFSIEDESPYTLEDLKPTPKPKYSPNPVSYGNSPKKGERKISLQDQHAVDSYRKKQKAWAATLPPATEETCRAMRVYFPGTDEEFEKVIAKNNEERKSWMASSPPIARPPQPVVVSHQPLTLDEAPEYGDNYNDDELYEEIIEGPIW